MCNVEPMKKMSIKLGSTWINHPLTFQAATDDGLTTPKMNPLAAMGPKFLFNSTKKTRCQQVATAGPNTCNVMKVSTQRSHFTSALLYTMKVILRPAMRKRVGQAIPSKHPAQRKMPCQSHDELTLKSKEALPPDQRQDVILTRVPGSVWWIIISPMNNQ